MQILRALFASLCREMVVEKILTGNSLGCVVVPNLHSIGVESHEMGL